MRFRWPSFFGFMTGVLIAQTAIHTFESWKNVLILLVLTCIGIIWGFLGNYIWPTARRQMKNER